MCVHSKISAAASGAEAAADRYAVFKGLKAEIPHHMVRHLPASRCPMKRKVDKAFKSEDVKGLKLPRTKNEAVIDFIAVLPGVMSKVCTPGNIQSGFIKNEMLDPDALRFPSFNGMFSTCRSHPSAESYYNIRNQIGKIVTHSTTSMVRWMACSLMDATSEGMLD